MRPFAKPEVAAVFDAYPADVRSKLVAIRDLIFDTAVRTPGVGRIDETLKWGQPAYLTPESRAGSTFRIDAIRSQPGGFAVYFHCQTTLVETFRRQFGDTFRYEGNRALLFRSTDPVPEAELSVCFALALTYRLKRRLLGRHRVW